MSTDVNKLFSCSASYFQHLQHIHNNVTLFCFTITTLDSLRSEFFNFINKTIDLDISLCPEKKPNYILLNTFDLLSKI